MNQQQGYENMVSAAQTMILNTIGLLEETFESLEDGIIEGDRKKALEMLLATTLLVSQTDRGRTLFLKILGFSGKMDRSLAHLYWSMYDDYDSMISNRYFDISFTSPTQVTIRPNIL